MRHSKRWQLGTLVVALVLAQPVAQAQAPQKQPDDEGEEMTFEPDEAKAKKVQPPPPDNKPPSKTLARAIDLYEKKKDYNSASIELSKVLNKETQDSEASKQRAEFFMGKTLYQMGYYAASLAYFDRIVAKRTGHRYFGATLKWLAALSRVLPETSGILEKIGTYDPKDLEQPIMNEVRDELYYLLGRHYYRQGNFDQAISLFQAVKVESPFYVKAKFFEGVTYVRQYKGAPAVDAFKQILVIGQERPGYYTADDILTYEELANLQLARVFYSTQQYDVSIKYFEKLPQESPDWLESLFEAGVGLFHEDQQLEGAGQHPHAQRAVLRERVLPRHGRVDAAQGGHLLQVLPVRPRPRVGGRVQPELRPAARGPRSDPDALRGQRRVLRVHRQDQERPGRAERAHPARRGQLAGRPPAGQDLRLGRRSWTRSSRLLEQANKSWAATRVRAEVEQELTVQKSLAQADAGKLARERIKRMSDELRELSRDGRKIRIETLNNKAGQIDAQARGEQISGDHRQEPIVVDDEHFLWKFNGEYWKDELGYYRFKIRSRCPTKGAGI